MRIDRDQCLQAFLEVLTEPAFVIDEQKIVRAANTALARSLGTDQTTLVGKPMLEFLPPDVARQREPHMDLALQGQTVVFEDSRADRHFLNHLGPMFDEQGRVRFVAVFAIDVTSMKRAESAARASEEKYRTIVATCLEGVWYIDADAHTSFVNQQMASMLGYTVEYCLGRHLSEFMDQAAWAEAEKKLERCRLGISERYTFRFRHRLGHDVWTTLSTAPVLGAQGEYLGAVALVTDVSESRVLQQKVQHTQKLESLGILAGGIAHDFNNVLAGILGNISLAQNELSQDSRATFFLNEAELAARRAADLTRQMLAYSGRGNFAVDVIDLNSTIREVQSLLTTVVSKKASLEIRLPEGLPSVIGDATQIRQVVMNLVMNANDALKGEAGFIRVTTSVTNASSADLKTSYLDDDLVPGTYLCIEVADSGCGMTDEGLGRMFDPFYTTKSSGHGLGLAAVLGILRAHKAAIFVDSKLNQGTTFRILLPAKEGVDVERAPKVPTRPPLRSKLAGGRVLVADDEEAVRSVTCKTLERMGFECVSCSNGIEALNLLADTSLEVDLVVLDMTMPELGGDEVLAEMRRRGTTVPVILMSGFGASETDPGLLEGGPTDFIEKPFGPSELSRRVQRLIAQKKP